MSGEREVRIEITGDASSLVAATQHSSEGLENVAAATSAAADEQERYQQALQKMAEIQAEASGKTAGAQKQSDDSEWLAQMAERKQALKEVADGMEATVPAAKEARDSTAKLGIAHKELQLIMRAVAQESPAFGLAIRLASGEAAAAGIIGLIMLFHELRKSQEETMRAAEEMADAARKSLQVYEDAAWGAKGKLDEMRLAHNEWIISLLKGSRTATTAMDAQIAKLKEQADADRAVMEARKQTAKDEIMLQEATGKILPEQAQARMEAINGIGTAAAAGIGAKTRQEEIKAVEAAMASVAERAAKATAAAEQGMKTEESATQTRGKRLAELGGLVPDADSAATKADKEFRDAAARQSKFQNAPYVAGPYASIARELEEKKLREEVEGKELLADAKRNEAEELKKEKLKLEDAARSEAARVKRLQESAMALTTELEKLDAKLKTLRTSDQIMTAAEKEQAKASEFALSAGKLKILEELLSDPAKLAAISRKGDEEAGRLTPKELANPRRPLTPAEQTEAGVVALGDVKSAAGTANAIGMGKSVSGDSQRQMMEVASAVAGHQVNFKDAVAMMQATGKNIGLFTADVHKLAGVLGELASGHSALQGRMVSLEAQLRAIKAQQRESYNQ